MDLLSSILGSMDNPPKRNDKLKEIYEKQKKEYERVKGLERDELNRFRRYTEDRLGRLMKDDDRHFMEFLPMDQVHRSVVYDVSETAGLAAMSFGVEDERYVVVYKKEHLPSEDELNARKNGEAWNKQTAQQYADRRKQLQMKRHDEQAEISDDKASSKAQPPLNYMNKYTHLFDKNKDVGKTEINRLYGYVPSENKKDIRSIEQTMADIQAKKLSRNLHTKPTAKDRSRSVSPSE